MGFFTQKRQIDTVSLISVIIVTALITSMTMWMYFSSKMNKIQSNSEMKVQILKNQIETLINKNTDLQVKLDKVKAAVAEQDIETEVAPDTE
ncbi:MAG: hypothetical protein RBS89_00575 [Candidatus Delongbacteria bacterium]|jgi:Tfp pilus assembly protein PilO|nr:hypothetical protein [Candidatus Delongbacteria bacterium]